MKISRWLEHLLLDPLWGHKMRFVGGPRQCGKTTLAKMLLQAKSSEKLYYNWDAPAVRERYRNDSLFYRRDIPSRATAWACFDEIHKTPKWKNILKGIYDEDSRKLTLIVTGSARLVPSRRGGDSLAGRYLLFHLPPILAGELSGSPPVFKAPADPRNWLDKKINSEESSEGRSAIDELLKFGPFPEPLLKGSERFSRLWRRNYLDSVIRGDLRDLTRLHDLESVENLISMIPDRVGSPFSMNAVREDLDVAFGTVKNMLRHLERLYVTFSVSPFTGALKRPVKKERKLYLFEWSLIQDPGARFENLVALELLALTWLWRDSGAGDYELSFVRTREGRETDFLITRNGAPWCLFECKFSPANVAPHHLGFAQRLGQIPVVQVVRRHGHLRAEKRDVVEISAARLLA